MVIFYNKVYSILLLPSASHILNQNWSTSREALSNFQIIQSYKRIVIHLAVSKIKHFEINEQQLEHIKAASAVIEDKIKLVTRVFTAHET